MVLLIVDWEILHGGVGGDVELGTRTSKQILVFAFDPISLNSYLFTFVQAFISYKHHSFHTYYILACVALHLYIAIHYYMLGLIVCVCIVLLYP